MDIPLNIDWRQILLHLFNFAILTGSLFFLLYNPISKFIKKREAHYRDMDNEADSKLKSAEKDAEQAKQRLESLDREILEKRMAAEAQMQAYADQQKQEADAEAEQIIAEARRTAEEEKRAVLDSAEKEIIALAKRAAAKIVHSSTAEAYDSFLEAAERDEEHEGNN